MRSDIKILSEKHVYDSDFKLHHFGYGEWVEELDVFQFSYCGYTCMVSRTVKSEFDGTPFGGHLCGYILVPEEHVFFGREAEDIPIDVHWCVTFCEKDGKTHMIGFDCAHSGDLVPSHHRLRRFYYTSLHDIFVPPEGLEKHPWFHPTYKNLEYCVDECCHVVDQLEVIQTAATARTEDEDV